MKNSILLAFILILLDCNAFAETVLNFPKTTGLYAIGLKQYQFKDPKRQDPFLNEKHSRDLIVNVYYPAKLSSSQVYAPYLDKKIVAAYQEDLAKEGYKSDLLKEKLSNALIDASIADEQSSYPMVLFSPGSGVLPEFYSVFIDELVSRGWVVAAINHTYISMVSLFPDGTMTNMTPSVNLRKNLHFAGEDTQGTMIKIVADDIKQTLDALKNIDLAKNIDFQSVSMIGHSLGGMAVTYACLHEAACRAGINMDGPLFGAPSSVLHAGDLDGDLTKPFLFIVGKMILNSQPDKAEIAKQKDLLEALHNLHGIWSAEEFYAIQQERLQGRILKAIQKMGKNAEIVRLEKTEHMSFSDWAVLESALAAKPKSSDQAQYLVEIRTLLVHFLEKNKS